MNRAAQLSHVSYDLLPSHMRDGMRRYLEDGIEPGGFALACLANELVGAFGRADDVNALAMREWAEWLYNECPSQAWGSREKVNAWIKSFHNKEEAT